MPVGSLDVVGAVELGPVLHPIPRTSKRVSDLVYDALAAAIRDLRLPPGCPLPENELAARLHVSRTPVREAIGRLVEARLVRVVPQVGTRVERISMSEVREAKFVREALEVEAFREACSLGAADLTELHDCVRRQAAARRTNDLDAFFEADEQMHAGIFALAGHRGAWDVVVRSKVQLDRLRRLSLPTVSTAAALIVEHKAIVDALSAGDVEAGSGLIRAHAGRVLTLQPAIAKSYPDYFRDGEPVAVS